MVDPVLYPHAYHRLAAAQSEFCRVLFCNGATTWQDSLDFLSITKAQKYVRAHADPDIAEVLGIPSDPRGHLKEIRRDRAFWTTGWEKDFDYLVLAPRTTTRNLISTQEADDSVVLLDEYQLGVRNLRPWKQALVEHIAKERQFRGGRVKDEDL